MQTYEGSLVQKNLMEFRKFKVLLTKQNLWIILFDLHNYFVV